MPIRFRCPKCEQLLGIARRKAGTMVRCPTCQHEVLVPTEETAGEDSPHPRQVTSEESMPAPAPALFERDDFEAILQGGLGPKGTGAGASQPGSPKRASSVISGSQEYPSWAGAGNSASLQGGLLLSPSRATVLTVVVVVSLAVSFALGLIIGKFLL